MCSFIFCSSDRRWRTNRQQREHNLAPGPNLWPQPGGSETSWPSVRTSGGSVVPGAWPSRAPLIWKSSRWTIPAMKRWSGWGRWSRGSCQRKVRGRHSVKRPRFSSNLLCGAWKTQDRWCHHLRWDERSQFNWMRHNIFFSILNLKACRGSGNPTTWLKVVEDF